MDNYTKVKTLVTCLRDQLKDIDDPYASAAVEDLQDCLRNLEAYRNYEEGTEQEYFES